MARLLPTKEFIKSLTVTTVLIHGHVSVLGADLGGAKGATAPVSKLSEAISPPDY